MLLDGAGRVKVITQYGCLTWRTRHHMVLICPTPVHVFVSRKVINIHRCHPQHLQVWSRTYVVVLKQSLVRSCAECLIVRDITDIHRDIFHCLRQAIDCPITSHCYRPLALFCVTTYNTKYALPYRVSVFASCSSLSIMHLSYRSGISVALGGCSTPIRPSWPRSLQTPARTPR